MVLHKGQRYLKLTTDGYIYPYTKSLSKQKRMVEYFPFEEDPPEEVVATASANKALEEKLDLMTKRQINEFAKLGKTDNELRLTGKPSMVKQGIDKLTWR